VYIIIINITIKAIAHDTKSILLKKPQMSSEMCDESGRGWQGMVVAWKADLNWKL